MEKTYRVGDVVIISKRLTENGKWINTDPRKAEIVEVRDTVSLGPAHTLQINGERLSVCYWTSDIDGFAKLYSDPDMLWKAWGDQ